MALTRKLLKGMGLTEEQMDTIIEAHTDTVDGLKSDIARYKADAEKLPGVQAELETLKAKGDDGWKDKHDKVKKEFDDYKREQLQKETKSAKEAAYRELLKSAGISEKRIDAVLKVTDLTSVELEDGKIKNAAAQVHQGRVGGLRCYHQAEGRGHQRSARKQRRRYEPGRHLQNQGRV